MSVIKVGVIGTGFSAKSHIEALRRLNGVEVAAISARTLEKAKKQPNNLGSQGIMEMKMI